MTLRLSEFRRPEVNRTRLVRQEACDGGRLSCRLEHRLTITRLWRPHGNALDISASSSIMVLACDAVVHSSSCRSRAISEKPQQNAAKARLRSCGAPRRKSA